MSVERLVLALVMAAAAVFAMSRRFSWTLAVGWRPGGFASRRAWCPSARLGPIGSQYYG